MKILKFLRAASWPAKSASRCGRTAVSSSGRFSADTRRRGASAIRQICASAAIVPVAIVLGIGAAGHARQVFAFRHGNDREAFGLRDKRHLCAGLQGRVVAQLFRNRDLEIRRDGCDRRHEIYLSSIELHTHKTRYCASSFKPARMSTAVSASGPSRAEILAIAAAAWG